MEGIKANLIYSQLLISKLVLIKCKSSISYVIFWSVKENVDRGLNSCERLLLHLSFALT